METSRPTEQGLYRDPGNGDMWELNSHGWRWVNGNSWFFVPDGLLRIGDTFEQRIRRSTDE